MKQSTTLATTALLLTLILACHARQSASEPGHPVPMNLPIKAMTLASLHSGTYGGSTQHEVFPSTYSYAHFSLDEQADEALQAQFTRLLQAHLEATTVNNQISLRAYLALLHAGDSTRLKEVHDQHQEPREVGNARQPLPTLFFLDDDDGTVLRINPYSTTLSWNQAASELDEFMRQHARQFSAAVPDAFYQTHYGQ